MKVFKKIVLWTLVPITFQLIVLFGIDKFYLNDETSFNTKKVDIAAKKEPNKIKVTVPEDAKEIGVSYNGNYVSYYEDKVIKIVDTSNNKKNEISFDNNAELSYYKWLSDRDIMLIAEKYTDARGVSYLKFQSYNPKKDEKSILSNEKNKELKINLTDSKYEVMDIAISSATNVTYVKVGKEGARSRLYRINVMAQVEETKYNNGKLGEITALNKEDRLVYRDITYNRIRVVGLKDPIATGEDATHYLLSSDNEDNVYIGNGAEGKVKKIFVASLKNPRSEWKIIPLSEKVNKSDIYITESGKMYINDPLEKVVTDIESGNKTKYKGDIIKVCTFGILSRNDGKVIGTTF